MSAGNLLCVSVAGNCGGAKEAPLAGSRAMDLTNSISRNTAAEFRAFGLSQAQHDYPDPLRRIGYRDPLTGKSLVFLTNNFTVPALTIAQLYRGRWQIELFFK